MSEEQFWQCMQQMRAGDKNALKTVYQAYVSYIYTIVRNMIESREDAEDITSDFFLKLWNLADTYQPARGHKAYLATIARNMTIDYLRKHRHEVATDAFVGNSVRQEQDDTDGQAVVKEQTADRNVEQEVITKLSIKQALAILNEAERKIVHLKIMGEMTFQEIARILQIPMGTVTWRYQSAVKKLRRCGYEQGF